MSAAPAEILWLDDEPSRETIAARRRIEAAIADAVALSGGR